jgi:glycine/D-amino acid oxidase-like deaminating enzyme
MTGRKMLEHDVAIVGQGLAGSTLAWSLAALGQRVVMIEPETGPSASRVSAGLITPVTGQRFAAAYATAALADVARFYRGIETASGRPMLQEGAAVRVLADPAEQTLWARRRGQADIASHVIDAPLPLDPARVAADFGGFLMTAARLDTPAFLAATKARFEVVPAYLDWHRDVALREDHVVFLGRRVGTLVTCEGWTARRNPYFPDLEISGSRGDVLAVRFERSPAEATLHRGIWVAPAGDSLHRVGATFSWTDLDQGPLPAARASLEAALRAFVHVPYDVIGHAAGVRPVAKRREVVMGRSLIAPRIAIFNGLGAKGTIRAAIHAPLLAAHLVGGAPIPAAVDVRAGAP